MCVGGGGQKEGEGWSEAECGPVVGQELPEIVKARQGPRTLEGQVPGGGSFAGMPSGLGVGVGRRLEWFHL